MHSMGKNHLLIIFVLELLRAIVVFMYKTHQSGLSTERVMLTPMADSLWF